MLNPRATRANPGWKWCTDQPRPCHTKICVTRDSWCGCMQQRTFVHASPCVSWCIKRKHSGAWSGACGNMRYARCNPWVLTCCNNVLDWFPKHDGDLPLPGWLPEGMLLGHRATIMIHTVTSPWQENCLLVLLRTRIETEFTDLHVFAMNLFQTYVKHGMCPGILDQLTCLWFFFIA